MCHLYYIQGQKLLQERVKVETKKVNKRELTPDEQQPYLTTTYDERKSKVRLVLNIVWSCLMVGILTARIWSSWLGGGFFDSLFGIIYEIVIVPFWSIIDLAPILIEPSAWFYPTGQMLLMSYSLNVLLVLWYVWIVAKCITVIIGEKSEESNVILYKR